MKINQPEVLESDEEELIIIGPNKVIPPEYWEEHYLGDGVYL